MRLRKLFMCLIAMVASVVVAHASSVTFNFTGVSDGYKIVQVLDDEMDPIELNSPSYTFNYSGMGRIMFQLSAQQIAEGYHFDITCDKPQVGSIYSIQTQADGPTGEFVMVGCYDGANGYEFTVNVTGPTAAPVPFDVYVVGNGTGMTWDLPGQKYSGEDDVVTFNLQGVSQFKVSKNYSTEWDGDGSFNAGAYATGSSAFGDAVANPGGQTLPIEGWGENQALPWIGDYTITIDYNAMTMNAYTTTPKPANGPDVFIRGTMNDWNNLTDAWKFTNVSYDKDSQTGVWTWEGQLVKGQTFKIADKGWGDINYSTNNKNTPAEGNPINLSYNSGDMAMAEDFNGTITLEITNYSGHVATATFTPKGSVTYPDNMYVIGTINGGAWNPSNVAEMTGNGDGVYTIESVTLAENGGSTGFAITVGGSDWGAVNSRRYGPSEQDSKVEPGLITAIAMGDLSWQIDPGTYKMVFDITIPSLTITKLDDVVVTPPEVVIPDKLYILGNINGNNWATDKGPEAANNSGVFTWESIQIDDADAGYGYFNLSTVLASAWDGGVNESNRFGAESNNAPLAVGAPAAIKQYTVDIDVSSCQSWKVAAGTYNITADLNDMEISIATATTEPEPEEPGEEGPFDVTYDFNSWDNLTAYVPGLPALDSWTADGSNKKISVSGDVMKSDGVSLTVAQAAGTQPPVFYSYSGSYDLRWYASNTLTITAPQGGYLTEILFTCSTVNTQISKMALVDGQPGTLVNNSSAKTQTWTAPEGSKVTSVQFTTTGATRIATINVVGEVPSTDEPEPEGKKLYVATAQGMMSNPVAAENDEYLTWDEDHQAYVGEVVFTRTSSNQPTNFRFYEESNPENYFAPASFAYLSLDEIFDETSSDYTEYLSLQGAWGNSGKWTISSYYPSSALENTVYIVATPADGTAKIYPENPFEPTPETPAVWTFEGQISGEMTLEDGIVTYVGTLGAGTFHIVKTVGETETVYGAETADNAANQITVTNYSTTAVEGSELDWVLSAVVANGVNEITMKFNPETLELTVDTKIIDKNSYLGTSSIGAPEEPNKNFVLVPSEDGMQLTGTFTIQPNQNFNIFYNSPFNTMDEQEINWVVLGPASQTDVKFAYNVSDFTGEMTNENPSYWTLANNEALDITFTVNIEDGTLSLVNNTEITPTYIQVTEVADPAPGQVAPVLQISVTWPGVTLAMADETPNTPNQIDLSKIIIRNPFGDTVSLNGTSMGGDAYVTTRKGSDEAGSNPGTEENPGDGGSEEDYGTALVINLPDIAYFAWRGNMTIEVLEGAVTATNGDINPTFTLNYTIVNLAELRWNPAASDDEPTVFIEGEGELYAYGWNTDYNITMDVASINSDSENKAFYEKVDEEGRVDAMSLLSVQDGKLMVNVASLGAGEYGLVIPPGLLNLQNLDYGEYAVNSEGIYNFIIEEKYIPEEALIFADFDMELDPKADPAAVATIPVSLDVTEVVPYSGFQFDITLPSFLSITGITLNEDIKANEYSGVRYEPQNYTEGDPTITYRVVAAFETGWETDLAENIASINVAAKWNVNINEGKYDIVIANPAIFAIEQGADDLEIKGHEGFVNITILGVDAEEITIDKVTVAEPSIVEGDMIDEVTQGQSLEMEVTVNPEDAIQGPADIEWTSDVDGVEFTWDEENEVWVVNTDKVVIPEGETSVDVTITGTAGNAETTYQFTVNKVILGDSNDNTNVNVADVVTTANYIATKPVSIFNFPNANVILNEVDGKQVINTDDLTATIDIIMNTFSGNRNPQSIRRYTRSMINNDRLVSQNFTVKSDREFTIAVDLENTYNYAALQADIVVPEGMKVHNVTNGPRAAAHELVWEREGNVVHVVLFSYDNSSFLATDGALFNLVVTADSNCSDNLVIEKIHASDAQSNGYDLNFEGGLNNAVETGVNGLFVNDNENVRYFDVNGIEVRNPEAGQILIRVEGDKVEKFIVK